MQALLKKRIMKMYDFADAGKTNPIKANFKASTFGLPQKQTQSFDWIRQAHHKSAQDGTKPKLVAWANCLTILKFLSSRQIQKILILRDRLDILLINEALRLIQ